jgi:hypothetical protein
MKKVFLIIGISLIGCKKEDIKSSSTTTISHYTAKFSIDYPSSTQCFINGNPVELYEGYEVMTGDVLTMESHVQTHTITATMQTYCDSHSNFIEINGVKKLKESCACSQLNSVYVVE